MKKRIAALLCIAVALLSTAAPPALAAGQHYPISVETYMEGDNPRIRKVYQLSLTDDPSAIPTGDFERDGRLYSLLDMTRADEVGVDTQTYTETVTMDSDTGDLSTVLQRLDGQKEVTTADGYTGVLILDHTSVKVEVKGYKTSTKSLSATRTYPNLSDADLSLIPKTITDSGATLTLADVQWANDGTYYTASASYTGSSTSRYATGYTVTANYTGEVAKPNCEVVTYTAIFGSTELSTEESEELEPVQTPEPKPAPELEQEQALEQNSGSIAFLPLLACLGGGAVFAVMAMWGVQKMKDRKERI